MVLSFRRVLPMLALGVLAAGCSGLNSTKSSADADGPAVGKPVPLVSGTDLEGKPLELSEFHGKVVMLSFWAGWCGPCVALVPHERETVERFAGRPFVLVGVNKDRTLQKGRQFQESHDMSWRSFWDGDNAIVTAYDVDSYPSIFLIDHKGVLRYSTPGISASVVRQIDRELDRLVKEAESGS